MTEQGISEALALMESEPSEQVASVMAAAMQWADVGDDATALILLANLERYTESSGALNYRELRTIALGTESEAAS